MTLTAGDRWVSTPADPVGMGESASCQPASPFIKSPAQLAGAAGGSADQSGRRSLPRCCPRVPCVPRLVRVLRAVLGGMVVL